MSFLNNVVVAKFKDIQGSYLRKAGNRGSLDANKNGKDSRRRYLNNPKEMNTTNREKKRVLPNTTENQTEVEVVSVPIDEYNSLKTELNSIKRVYDELCDTIALWNEKCRKLESNLNASKLVATCAMTSSSSLPSRSSSLVPAFDSTKGSLKSRGDLSQELSLFQVPALVCSHSFDLYDRTMFFAHLYPTETCLSESFQHCSNVTWIPNEEESESNVIRDWKRTIRTDCSNYILIPSAVDAKNFRASLPLVLYCKEKHK